MTGPLFRFGLVCALLLPAPARADGKQEARELVGDINLGLDSPADLRGKVSGMEGADGNAPQTDARNVSDLGSPEGRPELITGKAGSANDTMDNQPNTPDIAPSEMSRSRRVLQNPGAVQGLGEYLTSSYTDCTVPPTRPEGAAETRFCDEYKTAENRTCAVGRRVEVDAEHTYQCDQGTGRLVSACARRLTVSCSRYGSCPAAAPPQGVALGLAHPPRGQFAISAGHGSLNNGTLTPGWVMGQSFWTPIWVDTSLTVTLADSAALNAITGLSFNRPGLIESVAGGGGDSIRANGNLLPHLRAGQTVSFRVFFRTNNHENTKLTMTVRCCTQFRDNWSETCAP